MDNIWWFDLQFLVTQTHTLPQFVHLSGFVVAQSLQEQSTDALSSLFHTKSAKLEAAILHFKDAASFICVLCDLIAHHTF